MLPYWMAGAVKTGFDMIQQKRQAADPPNARRHMPFGALYEEALRGAGYGHARVSTEDGGGTATIPFDGRRYLVTAALMEGVVHIRVKGPHRFRPGGVPDVLIAFVDKQNRELTGYSFGLTRPDSPQAFFAQTSLPLGEFGPSVLRDILRELLGSAAAFDYAMESNGFVG